MLFWAQLLHTLIILWMYACLVLVLYAHATGYAGRWLFVAYASLALEGAAIIPLGFVCPLRGVVDRIAGPSTNDSLIPVQIAEWVMPVGLALVAAAILVVPLRWLHLRRQAGRAGG